jgi:hypothetical protein
MAEFDPNQRAKDVATLALDATGGIRLQWLRRAVECEVDIVGRGEESWPEAAAQPTKRRASAPTSTPVFPPPFRPHGPRNHKVSVATGKLPD